MELLIDLYFLGLCGVLSMVGGIVLLAILPNIILNKIKGLFK